jgi:hypothetical protein
MASRSSSGYGQVNNAGEEEESKIEISASAAVVASMPMTIGSLLGYLRFHPISQHMLLRSKLTVASSRRSSRQLSLVILMKS